MDTIQRPTRFIDRDSGTLQEYTEYLPKFSTFSSAFVSHMARIPVAEEAADG